MLRMLVVMAFVASPASAQMMLGPSGVESREPFGLITEEYVQDFQAAAKCAKAPKAGGEVFEGKLAIYYKPASGDVEVMQDEFARRFALDYCWI